MIEGNVSTPRADHRTQRQRDNERLHRFFADFCDRYPAAGQMFSSLGEKYLDTLIEELLLCLHPQATDMYSDMVATGYDLPPGVCI